MAPASPSSSLPTHPNKRRLADDGTASCSRVAALIAGRNVGVGDLARQAWEALDTEARGFLTAPQLERVFEDTCPAIPRETVLAALSQLCGAGGKMGYHHFLATFMRAEEEPTAAPPPPQLLQAPPRRQGAVPGPE